MDPTETTALPEAGEPAQGVPEAPATQEAPDFGRCLTLLADGMALNMPEIEPVNYQAFRERIETMSRQLPDRLQETDALPIVKAILRESEVYRKGADAVLRERQMAWRNLAGRLLRELLGSLRIDANSTAVQPLGARIGALRTAEEIRSFQEMLDRFLRPRTPAEGPEAVAMRLQATDHSTENTNAAGLRGGGAALEHLEKMMQKGSRGYLVLFHLGCLEMIHDRFGMEAVEDCLMAVAAHLTHSLHNDDAIFHWSDSSLLAILQGRISEQILSAELNRILSRNRELSIAAGGRMVMLRVPIEFDITSVSQLRDPKDVYKLSKERIGAC